MAIHDRPHPLAPRRIAYLLPAASATECIGSGDFDDGLGDMGLMRFLRRRQRFSAPDAQPGEPLPRPPAPSPEMKPAVPELAFPALRKLIGAMTPGTNAIVRSDTRSGGPSGGPSGGQDILRFAENRDTRIAVVSDIEARREIVRLHEMINQLHRQRRQLREDRDRWERLARDLENELRILRSAEQSGMATPLATANRFRRAKIVLARLTHPDSSGATGIEASIRAKLFQEFWAEFERIETE